MNSIVTMKSPNSLIVNETIEIFNYFFVNGGSNLVFKTPKAKKAF